MGYIENVMTEKNFLSPVGEIHYWVSSAISRDATQAPWLIFLPGLTADHRLFEEQIACFQDKCNCLVWDAPAHGQSRPAELFFSLCDLTFYLHDILEQEHVTNCILVGQSLGGYIAQMYLALYSDSVGGFIAIDSAPLEREYYATWELFCIKHTKWMYKSIPWNKLVQWSAVGNAETDYGRQQMREMMLDYTPGEFINLASYGFRMLAEAIEQYEPDPRLCPVLLLCGEHDKTGFVKRYNKAWAKKTGYPLVWIPKAGHNANADNPDAVNAQIEHFLQFVKSIKTK